MTENSGGSTASTAVEREATTSICVGPDRFAFGAAHMGLHEDGLERLHGHTYRVRLRMTGA